MQDKIVANPTLGKAPNDNDRENAHIASFTGLPLWFALNQSKNMQGTAGNKARKCMHTETPHS